MLAHQGTINKQLASKTVANNAWVYPHVNRTIVRASRSVNLNKVAHQASLPLEFVPDADESEEGPCGFLGRLDMPIIEPGTSGPQFKQNGCSAAVRISRARDAKLAQPIMRRTRRLTRNGMSMHKPKFHATTLARSGCDTHHFGSRLLVVWLFGCLVG